MRMDGGILGVPGRQGWPVGFERKRVVKRYLIEKSLRRRYEFEACMAVAENIPTS